MLLLLAERLRLLALGLGALALAALQRLDLVAIPNDGLRPVLRRHIGSGQSALSAELLLALAGHALETLRVRLRRRVHARRG